MPTGTTAPPTARAAAVADSPAAGSDWGKERRAHGRNSTGRPPASRILGARRIAAMTSVSRQMPAGVGPCCSTTYAHSLSPIRAMASAPATVWSMTAMFGPAAMPIRTDLPAASATFSTIAGRSLV